jgi:hypothetical protein
MRRAIPFLLTLTLVLITNGFAAGQLIPDPAGSGVPVPSFYFRSVARSAWWGKPASPWDIANQMDKVAADLVVRYEMEAPSPSDLDRNEYIAAMRALSNRYTVPATSNTSNPYTIHGSAAEELLPTPTPAQRELRRKTNHESPPLPHGVPKK